MKRRWQIAVAYARLAWVIISTLPVAIRHPKIWWSIVSTTLAVRHQLSQAIQFAVTSGDNVDAMGRMFNVNRRDESDEEFRKRILQRMLGKEPT